MDSLPSKSAWQEYLKLLIDEVKAKTASVGEFLKELADSGVTVTERQKKTVLDLSSKSSTKKWYPGIKNPGLLPT